MVKPALLIVSAGSGNFGDEAARIAATHYLKSHGYPEVMVSAWGTTALYCAEGMVPFEAIDDIDGINDMFSMVMITGGGIVSPRLGLSLTHNFEQFLNGIKIPVYTVSIGLDLGASFDDVTKSKLKLLIEKSTYFSVRNQTTANLVKLLTGRDIEVTDDMALIFPSNPFAPGLKGKPEVIIAYSAYSAASQHTEMSTIVHFYAGLIKELKALGFTVTIFPFSPLQDNLTFMMELNKVTDEVYPITLYAPHIIDGIIRDSRIVIGGRLHACVFAAMHGKPFIGVNYHQKVKAFCDQIGWQYYSPKIYHSYEGYGNDPADFNAAEIASMAYEIVRNHIVPPQVSGANLYRKLESIIPVQNQASATNQC